MTVPRISRTRLRTDDRVDLAAEVVVPPAALAAVVLLHPHPLMGGDRHAPVVEHLFSALPANDVAALRFDFRGAGESEGSHGGGSAEALDASAAVHTLHDLTGLPIWLVGWSFGADVSLQVTDPEVAGWVTVAAPLRTVPMSDMAASDQQRPKHLLVAEHDQFLSPADAERAVAGWSATTLATVAGTDHFLAGRMGAVTDAVLSTLLPNLRFDPEPPG